MSSTLLYLPPEVKRSLGKKITRGVMQEKGLGAFRFFFKEHLSVLVLYYFQ